MASTLFSIVIVESVESVVLTVEDLGSRSSHPSTANAPIGFQHMGLSISSSVPHPETIGLEMPHNNGTYVPCIGLGSSLEARY